MTTSLPTLPLRPSECRATPIDKDAVEENGWDSDDVDVADPDDWELIGEDLDDDGLEHATIKGLLAWHLESTIHFYTHVLGGKWTKKHLGVAADGIVGRCRKTAYKWCGMYTFPRQAGHMFKKYGMDAATSLSREYCRRADFFYL